MAGRWLVERVAPGVAGDPEPVAGSMEQLAAAARSVYGLPRGSAKPTTRLAMVMRDTTVMSPDVAYDRVGSGPPLVLLHGLGLSRRVWRGVVDRLSTQRDVVAVDLPGFGDSPPLPDDRPTPAKMAEAIAALLDDLGLDRPHVAGHSMGGWVALELAAAGRASSVTALAPGGLWGDGGAPLLSGLVLRANRMLSVWAYPLAPVLLRMPHTRAALCWSGSARPWAMPPRVALEATRDIRRSTRYEATQEALRNTGFARAADVTVPVLIAVPERDWLIPRSAQRADQAPAQTQWRTLTGCGHNPMWDDPTSVVALLLEGSDSEGSVGFGAAGGAAVAGDALAG
jgi:pimeloyl-ACP methyl ester carboxylesterase